MDIPVTATLESAALVSHMMGASFSLVTVDHQNGKMQESCSRSTGCTTTSCHSAPSTSTPTTSTLTGLRPAR